MNRKFLRLLLPLLLTISCTTIPEANFVADSALPATDKAYIYGRFYQSELYEVKVGVILQNTTTHKEYRLPFRSDTFFIFKAKPVYAIELPPGEYRVKSFCMIKANALGPIIVERAPGSIADKTFTVNPGKAVYIGDYTGKSYYAFFQTFRWEAKFENDNYQKTTEEFRKRYPKFEGVVTVNGMGDAND